MPPRASFVPIYEACKYFELFQKTVFKGKCGLVTSYNPQTRDITTEDTGANTETDKEFIYNTYVGLLQNVQPKPGESATETYEGEAKRLFKSQPANMRLLIVVDKLLTGFDAPSCTFLYIDKSMQDHGLFQAICRTNRLDGDDKDFGFIVDYKDLFKKVENAIAVYTSELDHTAGGVDPEVLLKDRLTQGRERLDNALEALALLCQLVERPQGELEHIHYFCGNTELPGDLQAHETQRVALYKSVAALLRAYANLADELEAAGYTGAESAGLKAEVERYVKLREIIRKASGETIDLKAYEADMRHLIDTYIEAEAPRKISPFDDLPLLDLIVKTGIAAAVNSLPDGIKGSRDAVAETIANNVRSRIIKDHLNDPAYYDRMSTLLQEVIADLRAKRIDYEEYLKRVAELAKRVQAGHAEDTPEAIRHSPGMRALYNNLKLAPNPLRASAVREAAAVDGRDATLDLAVKIDAAVKRDRPDGWRGVQTRELIIKGTLFNILEDVDEVERVFAIIKQQREY